MRTPPIDRQAFHDWLSKDGGGLIAGYALSGDACPLACFLREQTGCQHSVSVSESYYQVGTGDMVQLPEWAAIFVDFVDRKPGAVFSRECLAILEVIPDE